MGDDWLTQLPRLGIPILQDGPATWTTKKKPNTQFKFEVRQVENSLLFDRDHSFLLFKLQVIGEAHIRECQVLYQKPTD